MSTPNEHKENTHEDSAQKEGASKQSPSPANASQSNAQQAKESRVKMYLMAFFIGTLFAGGLVLSGMTQPAKVIGFLDLFGDWDMSLMFVMGGAIAVHMPLRLWLLRSRSSPLMGSAFFNAQKTQLDLRLIAGAILFGVGWGLSGICPGPGIVGVTSGHWWFVVFIGAMIAGMVLYRIVEAAWLKRDEAAEEDVGP